jgi:hypothetical protein
MRQSLSIYLSSHLNVWVGVCVCVCVCVCIYVKINNNETEIKTYFLLPLCASLANQKEISFQ